MDITPIGYFENIKRYWRRRRYHRIDDATRVKRKLKIARLGNRNKQDLKIKKVPKLRFRCLSPLKLVEKFHEAYVDALVRLAGEKKKESFKEKKVPRGEPVPMLCAPTSEMVDSRMVAEIYKRVVSTREQYSAGIIA